MGMCEGGERRGDVRGVGDFIIAKPRGNTESIVWCWGISTTSVTVLVLVLVLLKCLKYQLYL